MKDKNIILFTNSVLRLKKYDHLHVMLQFLKSMRYEQPTHFSFCAKTPEYFSQQSLLESMMTDFNPNFLQKNKEEEFFQYLLDDSSPISKLYAKILKPKEICLNQSKRDLKIASIIKTLLADRTYYLFDCIDEDLDRESFELFLQILQDFKHLKNHHQDKKILIFSPDISHFSQLPSYHQWALASRDQSQKFQLESLPLIQKNAIEATIKRAA